jgi:hypothetical protein
MVVIQAPRGTVKELASYVPYLDITGVDVFPISYPPGGHLDKWPNHEISAVGDWARIINEAAGGKTVLDDAPGLLQRHRDQGRTLRMPTFPESRFMTYDAIINGARGVNYFGGANRLSLNERDAALGYNWTFWDRTLKPLLAEINAKARWPSAGRPNSKLPIKVNGEGIELSPARSARTCTSSPPARTPKTQQVEFTGCRRRGRRRGPVRRTAQSDGAAATLKDWFAPWDVHVYKFRK